MENSTFFFNPSLTVLKFRDGEGLRGGEVEPKAKVPKGSLEKNMSLGFL